MKKIATVCCLLLAAGVLASALSLAPELPRDTRAYIEKKYAGWNGVLRVWVYSGWDCGAGGFSRWLNFCASAFEKTHEGVYVEFEEVRADTLLFLRSSGLRPPEMLLFPPGLLSVPDGLLPLDVPDGLCDALARCGAARGAVYALPVAMGGYLLAHAGSGAVGVLALAADETHLRYSAGLAALLTESGEAATEPEYDPGLDLGLATFSTTASSKLTLLPECADAALALGDTAEYALLSLRGLAKLNRLREAGRGPDWTAEPQGLAAWSDQLLMLGILASDDAEASAREALCREFLALLLTDECQTKLATVGAIPVTNAPAYTATSVYSALERQLRTRELIVPGCFSEYWSADFADIVRDLFCGETTPETALEALRQRSCEAG